MLQLEKTLYCQPRCLFDASGVGFYLQMLSSQSFATFMMQVYVALKSPEDEVKSDSIKLFLQPSSKPRKVSYSGI